MPIKYSVFIVSEPDMGLLCEALFEALFSMCNAVKYAGLREECYLPPISPQPEHGHNTSIKHWPLQLERYERQKAKLITFIQKALSSIHFVSWKPRCSPEDDR